MDDLMLGEVVAVTVLSDVTLVTVRQRDGREIVLHVVAVEERTQINVDPADRPHECIKAECEICDDLRRQGMLP